MFGSNSGFASFSTNDLPATWDFYKGKLGLQVHAVGDDLNITFANGTHVLIYGKEDHVPASHTVLNIMVEDITEAAAMLKHAGIELERILDSGADGISRSPGQGMPNIGWFKDPAGNWLSIIETTDEAIS
ncbi:VOC family protein [Demequina oxidasica]|uniref:VOC family protein n=1 Tax=Demequina oxidasica TaxID=676199 RepID=UPI00078622FF|nr:VOC family protein [Demequina oxidasica]